MKITCNHPASSHGVPVILNDNGEVMEYAEGLTAALKVIGWPRIRAAIETGYKSKRGIDKYWQGQTPSARLLNVLSIELEKIEEGDKS